MGTGTVFSEFSEGFGDILFEMFVEPFKNGLEEISSKQILEKKSFRDESGWDYIFKIDGKQVSVSDYETEMKRVYLWKSEGRRFDRGYAIPSENLVLEDNKTIVQHFPLPFYRN